MPEKDQNVPFNPSALSYNIPLDNANSNKPVSYFLLFNQAVIFNRFTINTM